MLQVEPADNFTATFDVVYSRNEIEARNSSVGIWFNFADISSAWTDGPVAGPVFYSERFGPGKDLAYSGSLTANVSENSSIGGDLAWEGTDALVVTFDGHHSVAEWRPSNDFGSSTSVGNAVFGLQSQTLNFENYLPVISYTTFPGVDALDAALITPTGNSFRNAFFRGRINQAQLGARGDDAPAFLDALDFGVSYVNNKVRSPPIGGSPGRRSRPSCRSPASST